MTMNTSHFRYVPSAYAHKALGLSQRIKGYSQRWQQEHPMVDHQITNTITISRKIGLGAVEVADLVARQIGFQVADREVVNKIADDSDLNQKAVQIFDECYPGKWVELQYHFFGDKSFSMDSYVRRLFSVVYAMAETCSTIFVGRGAHLLLPRSKVLAVRMISSPEYRIDRVARILDVDQAEAEAELKQQDKDQKEFFKKVYGKKDASAYEFDLVLNCDYLSDPNWVADIIVAAYRRKFND
jgi:cytidylate kinase